MSVNIAVRQSKGVVIMMIIFIVIPDMECKQCGEKAPENYRPLSTKYAANETV